MQAGKPANPTDDARTAPEGPRAPSTPTRSAELTDEVGAPANGQRRHHGHRRQLRRRMLQASSAVTATPLDRQSTSIDSRRRGAPPRATPLTRPGHERAERGPAWNPAARSSPAISVEAVFKVDAYTREDSPNEVSLTGGAIGPPTGLAEQPRFQLGVLDDQHRIVA